MVIDLRCDVSIETRPTPSRRANSGSTGTGSRSERLRFLTVTEFEGTGVSRTILDFRSYSKKKSMGSDSFMYLVKGLVKEEYPRAGNGFNLDP